MPHITFIHGIANKPPKDRLLSIWREALKDGDLNLANKGITSSLVYWADVLYDKPAEADAPEAKQDLVTTAADDDLGWRQDLPPEEAAFVNALASKLNFNAPPPDGDDFYTPPPDEAGATFERIPLPWVIKRRIMKALLRDVHAYLFNTSSTPRPDHTFQVQDEIRRRLIDQLKEDAEQNAGGPHILMSHSMGTVISYDCLKRVDDCPKIDGFITLGSPLGLDEIQDKLRPEWSRLDGFPSEKLSGDWDNIYDPLDPVAGFDPKLANDYRQSGLAPLQDHKVNNKGAWRHDLTKYLAQPALIVALSRQLGLLS